MRNDCDAKRMGDDELLAALLTLADGKRRNDAAMLAHIAEVDRRRLYAGKGYSSMFEYCVKVLRLSEGATSKRVRAARLSRAYPGLIEMVAAGELHLAGICMLGKYLTRDNHRAVLARARGMTCKQLEHLIAGLAPRPAVPASVRKLPGAAPARRELADSASQQAARPVASNPQLDLEPDPEPRSIAAPASAAATTGRSTVDVCSGAAAVPGTAAGSAVGRGRRHRSVEVLAPERYLIKATFGEEAKAKLDRAIDLLRHSVPDGDIAQIFERALDALIDGTEKRRFGKADRPRTSRPAKKGARQPTAAMKREVVAHDGYRCSFTAESGRRCTQTGKPREIPGCAGSASS
jgi:hypothetical protein